MLAQILKLTRWREHYGFVIPITILGAIISSRASSQMLDYKLVFAVIGNLGAISYAFMINDVEDAVDDARDPKKAKTNPISSKKLDIYTAWTAIRLLAALTLLAYYFVNAITFGVGALILILSHMYSWKKVRLKAYPVADIVSHSLMLGGLLLITGFTVYSSQVRNIWLLAVTVSIGSAYGQLYNQLRDFETDRKAGLKNTSIYLGEKRTRYLMNVTIFLTAIGTLTVVYTRVFPLWLIFPVLASTLLASKLDVSLDARGTAVIDATGRMQLKMWLLGNVVVFSWLLEIFFRSF